MKILKTNISSRSIYTYVFDNNEKVVLRAGENGVTEIDIKKLHAKDDSEVYYNNKNLRPERTDAEKAEIKVFEDKFIADFIEHHGYEPNPSYVKYAIKEAFPSNWNLSLDYIAGEDEESSDKSHIALATSYEMEQSNPAVDRLHEVMETMTDKQREVLRMVKFEGYTLTEVAKILGTSIPNVKKHLDKAIENIEKNYYK